MKKFLFSYLIGFSFTGFAQQPIDVQHYKFEIELNDESNAINGKASITVKFLKDASSINFDLASPQDEKGMRVFQVKENEKLLQFTQSNNILTISLAAVGKNGESRKFEISYMGVPKDGLIISKNKFGDRTFFADNWPNRAHNWIPCIDRPNDKAAFEFIVTAPAHYRVISNGILIEESKLANNRKKTYWREETPLPTKIMVIGVARFAVKEFKDSPANLPVSAWVYPQDSVKGFYDYAITPSIVKFFSDYIAPYPFKKLANVQSTTMFGGMENAAAIFYGETTVTGDRKKEDLMVHEIAHQWFGDMASEKSFTHLWLSEGFATYLTNYYIEQKYGKDSAYSKLDKQRKDIINFVRSSRQAVVDSTSDYMSLLNENSYEKGAWILHMLRKEVGDDNFRKIIQTYYNQYKGSNADTRDFEAVVEKVSGKELTWFFDQWLYRGGIPELKIDVKKEKDELKVKVTQGKQLYRLYLNVLIESSNGKKQNERIEIKEKETEFKWSGKDGPYTFTIDDRDLLYDK